MSEDLLKRWLKDRRKLVEQGLRRMLPNGVPADLMKSIRYSLFAPGKRIRPVLVMASSEALGGLRRNALPPACAVEMIHAYSLIHDDLPAMDDDDYRRGRPSNHKEFDEATAILAGDALLTGAFEVITGNVPDPRRAARMVFDLATHAGGAGMVGGQMLDLSESTALSRIHRMKTAALFRTSLRLGAIAAAAPPRTINRMGEYGLNLGLAFQAVDDILDDENEPDRLRRRARKHTALALKAISFLGKRGENLRRLAGQLRERTK